MSKTPLVIILHNIRSAWNVGAIFRTADAVGVEKIYITGYTATPEHPKVPKTSIGAEKSVSWEQNIDVQSVIDNLKKSGYQIVGLEIHQNSKNFWNTKYNYPVALLLGNEIDGITDDLIKKCDLIIHIPMQGVKESLNVATATGIAVYEIAKPYIIDK